jgi:ribonuclease P protein component
MKQHETDLSSLENPPQAQIRLPRPHENGQRPQGDQPTPKSRPQDSLRLIAEMCKDPSGTHPPYPKLAFGKRDRLLKRHEFRRVSREGKRLVGTRICIDRSKGSTLRLGITASSHYGSAPERNRFKRLVREAFRLSRAELPAGIEINISPRKFAKEAALADIQSELRRLLNSPNLC